MKSMLNHISDAFSFKIHYDHIFILTENLRVYSDFISPFVG